MIDSASDYVFPRTHVPGIWGKVTVSGSKHQDDILGSLVVSDFNSTSDCALLADLAILEEPSSGLVNTQM